MNEEILGIAMYRKAKAALLSLIKQNDPLLKGRWVSVANDDGLRPRQGGRRRHRAEKVQEEAAAGGGDASRGMDGCGIRLSVKS